MKFTKKPFTYDITYQQGSTHIHMVHNTEFFEWKAIISDTIYDDSYTIKLDVTPLMLYEMFTRRDNDDEHLVITFPDNYTKKYDMLEIVIKVSLGNNYVNTRKIMMKPVKISSEIRLNKKLEGINKQIKLISDIIDGVPASIETITNVSKHIMNRIDDLTKKYDAVVELTNGLLTFSKAQTLVNDEIYDAGFALFKNVFKEYVLKHRHFRTYLKTCSKTDEKLELDSKTIVSIIEKVDQLSKIITNQAELHDITSQWFKEAKMFNDAISDRIEGLSEIIQIHEFSIAKMKKIDL